MEITYDSYQQFEKSIFKLVYKYCRKSSFKFDELLSEANMGFMKAVDTFDSSKACFHTHLVIVVNGRLRNYLRKEWESEKELQKPQVKDKNGKLMFIGNFQTNTPLEWDYIDKKTPNPEENATFKNLVESMSNEAKEVVNIVLNTPTEMIELIKKMKSNRTENMHLYRSSVTRFLKESDWCWSDIRNSYGEIRKTFGIKYDSCSIYK